MMRFNVSGLRRKNAPPILSLSSPDDANVDGKPVTTAGKGNSPADRFRSIRPTLLVTVPVLSLLRREQEPGILEGYGPIDPQTARELAAEAKSMIRILTHPETGVALSIGRTNYRIPKKLRYWLRFRDGTCRFPGCNRAAKFADIDHAKEWFADHGGTDHFNLNCLCPGHHAVKTHENWTPIQDPQGTGEIMWITPTGHLLWDYPENNVKPTTNEPPTTERKAA